MDAVSYTASIPEEEIMSKPKMETLLERYNEARELLGEYKKYLAIVRDPREAFRIQQNITEIELEVQRLETEINAIKAVETIASAQEDVEALHAQIDEPKLIASLESKLANLSEQYQQFSEKLTNSTSFTGIEPKLSVLRPNVRLVDANIAYKYVDLQSDVNILFGLTTLFLGIAASSGVSLGIEMASSQQNNTTSIYLTTLVMSVLVSMAFGYLTYRAYRKSTQVKAQLEADLEVNEIGLSLTEKIIGTSKTKTE